MRPRSAAVAAALAAGIALAGCDWFSTMSRTPSIQPFEAEPIPPPPGSVPVGGLPAYDLSTADAELVNPVAAGAASIAAGQAAFADFCVVCHGQGGRGGGPLAAVYPAIPALTTGRLADFGDGYLFALVTQGRGLMPGYARIPRRHRWDLVNHLRTLPGAAGGGTGQATPAAADTTAESPAGEAP